MPSMCLCPAHTTPNPIRWAIVGGQCVGTAAMEICAVLGGWRWQALAQFVHGTVQLDLQGVYQGRKRGSAEVVW